MSDPTQAFGFGKFVPGFEFLQGLANSAVKGAAQGMPQIPQLPNLSNWVAPTINVEELDKRITELKAVQFWLDQNANALKATIQALEVQKMTLATLQGMNFNMGDVANAFKLKAADTVVSGVQKVTETAAGAAGTVSGVASGMASMASDAVKASKRPAAGRDKSADSGKSAVAGVIDPMQWWGALSQQFQQIAANAMKDAARHSAMDTTRSVAEGLTKSAVKAATGAAKAPAKVARKVAAKAPASRKSAAGKPAAPRTRG
ncbi:MAG: hypothetical protein JNK28_14755 [Burkholderiaceae bacterium]|jgi:hypothetical protein|nr:hypothetical protein [Burkholderiaceae bacterium]